MQLEMLLQHIVSDNELHTKFLNTLSIHENIGTEKISANQLAETCTYMILKHAAEGHRHAFYLKKQIGNLPGKLCPTYEPHYLIATHRSKYYLNKLNTFTNRYLMNILKLKGATLKFAAYQLVTYAIEVRADFIYPIYQRVLTVSDSKVSVRSIIIEEKEHLEEMIAQLKTFSPHRQRHQLSSTVNDSAIQCVFVPGNRKVTDSVPSFENVATTSAQSEAPQFLLGTERLRICIHTGLILLLKAEVVLIVRNYLGCINHTLLSIHVLESLNIPLNIWY